MSGLNLTQVLDIDPANWKALYRRGQAHAAMGDVGRAVIVLEAALEAAPRDQSSAIAEKLAATRRTQAQRVADEQQVCLSCLGL